MTLVCSSVVVVTLPLVEMTVIRHLKVQAEMVLMGLTSRYVCSFAYVSS